MIQFDIHTTQPLDLVTFPIMDASQAEMGHLIDDEFDQDLYDFDSTDELELLLGVDIED